MPEVSLGYLLTILLDVGPVMPGGFGPAILSHGELRAWQVNAGITLQPWEVAMVRRLSAEYLKASAEAEDPKAPAPDKSMGEIASSNTAASLKAKLRRMA